MTDQQLLQGHGETGSIVSVMDYGQKEVAVFRREGGAGEKPTRERRRVHPFFFLKPSKAVRPDSLGAKAVRKLKGSLPFSHVLVFDSKAEWQRARKAVRYEKGDHDTAGPSSMEAMYLMQSGETLFGGFGGLDGARRMQLDIETLSPTGDFPKAENEGDRVCIVALSGNWRGSTEAVRGPDGLFEKLLVLEADTEKAERALLIDTVREVQRRDPDIIEMHNGFGFDLPYLLDRAERYGVTFGLGRDGTTKGGRERTKEFSESKRSFRAYEVPGRHIIDTMFLAADFDVYARALPSLGLKDVAKFFDVAPEGRTYVEGSEIDRLFRTDRERLLKYAMDDVRETRGVAEVLAPAEFFLSKMVPLNYGGVHLGGTASALENILTRGYLRERHSLPEPDEAASVMGGLTEIFRRGLFRRCAYADVQSLYPSIMMEENYFPSDDVLGFFRRTMDTLLRERLKNKRLMQEAAAEGDVARETTLNALQQSQKILINSGYGLQGSRVHKFNDMKSANDITAKGQDLLREMIGRISEEGGTPILADTDGCMFSLPEGSTDTRGALIERVDAKMPEGINIDNDGEFDRVLSYKRKNYAKRKEGSGTLSITGVSLKGRSMERFGREYISDMLTLIVDGHFEQMRERHLSAIRMIRTSSWPSPSALTVRSNLKTSLEADSKAVKENPDRHPMPQYEVGKWLARERGRSDIGPGSVVEWFVGKRGPQGRLFGRDSKVSGHARHVSQFEPGAESTAYYLGRLAKFAGRFELLFSPEDFHAVFPDPTGPEPGAEGLFGVDTSRVRVKESVVNTLESLSPYEDEVPF